MMINIPAIRNKYLRWVVTTGVLAVLLCPTLLIGLAINIMKVFDISGLIELIMHDLRITWNAIKQMYGGKK